MDKKELYKKVEDLDLFCIGIRKYVALSEVLYLIKQLNEPQKVVIPEFVADWIEYCKEHNFTLLGCLDPVDDFGTSLSEGFKGDTKKCVKWCRRESNTFALAWINGYEVEKEKRYLVKMNGVKDIMGFLNFGGITKIWFMGDEKNLYGCRTHHTRKELEDAGFGDVFNSPLFEVEEVEE